MKRITNFVNSRFHCKIMDDIDGLISGDVNVFESIFKKYSRELYFYAMGLCDDANVAEDAVQECFIYLWEHRLQLKRGHLIINYLRASVKHYILNYLRHLKVRMDHAEIIAREQLFQHEEEEDLTSKIEAIRRVIDSLPVECRKVFVMAVIEGMTYMDTAKAIGISVNTVKSQIRIAYRKIKDGVLKNPDNLFVMLLFISILKKKL